jgi:hypothetical protein
MHYEIHPDFLISIYETGNLFTGMQEQLKKSELMEVAMCLSVIPVF